MRAVLFHLLSCVPVGAFWRGLMTSVPISPLRNIVTSNAILSTVAAHMNIEFINEGVLFSELTNFTIHPQTSTFYITSLITVAAVHYYVFMGKESRWADIGEYTGIQKITSRVLFICFIVFTKGIENAI